MIAMVAVQVDARDFWELSQPMITEHAMSVLVPLLVLVVLWTVVRHWILPFVLGFALAVALGPSARPLMEAPGQRWRAWARLFLVGLATTLPILRESIWTDVDRLPAGMTTRRRASGGFCNRSVHSGRPARRHMPRRRASPRLKGRAGRSKLAQLLRLPGPMERATSP